MTLRTRRIPNTSCARNVCTVTTRGLALETPRLLSHLMASKATTVRGVYKKISRMPDENKKTIIRGFRGKKKYLTRKLLHPPAAPLENCYTPESSVFLICAVLLYEATLSCIERYRIRKLI